MTWKLWRALQRPPVRHPLYRRALLLRPAEGLRFDDAVTLHFLWRLVLPLLFMSIFALTPIILPLVIVTPLLLPVIINWCSIQWAVRTGGAIASENERGTYDLAALTPPGAFGASWTICSACIHRGSSFSDLHTFVRVLVKFLFLMTGIGFVIAILIAAARSPGVSAGAAFSQSTFVNLFHAAALVTAFYLDHVQSVVVGGLVGMLAPNYVRNHLDARAWGLFGYLLLQVGTYLLTWLIGFQVIPVLYEGLNLNSIYAEFSIPILRVAVFYGIREGIIAGLWLVLTGRLNAMPSDLDDITP
jgi:hypothetical protein